MKEFSTLFPLLQQFPQEHGKSTNFYQFLEQACSSMIADSGFSQAEPCFETMAEFGEIVLPYYSMGNIDSLKLFGLDELIIFAFYLANKDRYQKVADMGANIGLHTLLMAKLGWQVTAFEPDPVHVAKIHNHLALNKVAGVDVVEKAVSTSNETLTFTRLIGNRTGSHLKGCKQNIYGEVEEFAVECLPFAQQMKCFDFIKMDIEGAEAAAICSTAASDWESVDVMLEVGTTENAAQIWQHINTLGLNAFSQKTGWQRAQKLQDIPTGYIEGSLFLSMRTTGFIR